jgi:hypothetical protein
MKRFLAVLALLIGVVGSTLVLPASAATPYCGIEWGSLPKHLSPGADGQIVDFRTGQHSCFDRLVIDVQGDVSGYSVQYVSQVRQDGSGHVVPVSGGARLEVIARVGIIATDSFFVGNGTDVANVTGYTTFRQVTYAGSFEGQTSVGLGVRARLPFRVFLLDGPGSSTRMVVDVAHRW